MNKGLTILLFFLSLATFAQETLDYNAKLDILNGKIKSLESEKFKIEKEIDSLVKEKKNLFAEQGKSKINSEGYVGIIKGNKTPIFEDTESYNVVKTLNDGDSVKILGYKNEKLFIDYLGFFGFIHPLYLQQDSLIINFVGIEKEQEEITAKLERKELEDSQRKASLLRQEQLTANRNKKIKSLYPVEIAQKIIDRKIWIGMTSSMAVLSIGSPKDINRTVTGYQSKEQWVYDSMYLYFDDGILTAFQD